MNRLAAPTILSVVLACGAVGAEPTFEIRPDTVELKHLDYQYAVRKDDHGVPRIDWARFKGRAKRVVTRRVPSVVLKNDWFQATLIPRMGRLHSFVSAKTGREQLWVNPIAVPLGANNDTGYWMTWGGIEHVLPRAEHGTSHALDWEWATDEDSTKRKAVRMWTTEPLTGFRHTVTYAIYPSRRYLETVVEIRNPTDRPAKFSHWTTATLAPGGRGEVTAKTEIVVPADRFVPDDRDFNVWMEGMDGPTHSSPLRFVGNWKSIGDLMASPLEQGYYAAYSHEFEEGVIRAFDLGANPGFDIWGWGFPPTEQRQREFTAGLPNAGYIEFWNGTARGFGEDDLTWLGAGEELDWKEYTMAISDLGSPANLRGVISGLVSDQIRTPTPDPSAFRESSLIVNRGELIETIELNVIGTGEPEVGWFQSRPVVIPSDPRRVMVSTQQLRKDENHGYYNIYSLETIDHGKSWSRPLLIDELRRARTEDGYEVVAGDLWPTWHAPTQLVVATGKTFNFAGGVRENIRRERVSYAVFDPKSDRWSELKFVKMPEHDHEGKPIVAPNAGCNQPSVLSDGQLLLPIRYQKDRAARNYTTIVARCRFDGATLEYVEHGSELSHPRGRGLYEPSVTAFEGNYYLTMRADHSAYVARSADGLEYEDYVEWRFDDGEPLGSYNTQQHWVAHSKGLFLVYTRKGANNDRVFRHRAPLFIAQVDPETLRVMRRTERVLVPENDAGLGNFGVCHVTPNETWVVTSEYLRAESERVSDPNRILLARIHWREPNGAVSP